MHRNSFFLSLFLLSISLYLSLNGFSVYLSLGENKNRIQLTPNNHLNGFISIFYLNLNNYKNSVDRSLVKNTHESKY